MYLSLYRKWRPRTFDEMCGQEHITAILKKQCINNRVSHAYLFCGTRGTGKTSSAKILAKAVNCENPVDGNPCNQCAACKSIDNGSSTDVLEIDAASNNKVDNVRDLRDEVVYPPSVLKKRVYIIDEVHMLTDSAFNALLKTLEEPPEYVVFILATTEINELPPTIISRCIRFDFSRIDVEAVEKRIEYVAGQESIPLAEGAANLLAQLADGSMRDALSLLEACSNGISGGLTKEAIRNTLGLAGEETIFSLLHAVANKNVPEAIDIVNEVHRSSKDISVFIDDFSATVRDLIIHKQLIKFGKNGKIKQDYINIAEEFTLEQLFYLVSVLEETQGRISKYAMNKRIVLEMSIIKMCDRSISDSPKALAARISELEKKISLMAVKGVPTCDVEETKLPLIEVESKESKEHVADDTEERIPFADISEVYELLSGSYVLSSFLQQADIYLCDSNVIISGESFVIDMIKAEAKTILRDAFCSVIGKPISIVYEEKKAKSASPGQISFIHEI